MESLASISQSLKMYTYKELQAGTDNFSPNCLIKGNVYRGTFNGDFAAIKKMSGDVTKEINILNKINHLNLIRLSGFCFNQGDSYLIYEYAANGPLSDWIYANGRGGKFLSWTQRIQIALDVATGLNYLHSYTTPPHVHQDVKCSSVFLDSDFRAKIANFDMVRSAEGKDGEFVLTRHIVGTKGYMAPEYLEDGLISTKLDVYAFGILSLEILTGKDIDALCMKEKKAPADILKPVLHEEDKVDNLKELIDPALGDHYPLELASLVAHLIDQCSKNNPSVRPGMDEVVTSLSRILNSSLTWDFSNNLSEYHSVSH
uniref:Protein kinase domain-containing protein n=1 Tax=Kalanchoe fedtschenkoi TaxID=63787 RepID=A0A7N0ULZ4_KALFE